MVPVLRASAWWLAAALTFSLPAPAFAQSGLTVMPGPNGGRIVHGAVTGVSSVPSAMGAVLRKVHQEFNARPQVGRPFELREGGQSAVHFDVRPASGPPVAGLVVVAPTGPSGFEAGVVFDRADHLAASFEPMLRSLMQAWHPGPSGAPTATGPAAPLQAFTLPDHSASVGLPAGWQVDRTSGGGTLIAHGPNGEQVALGYPYIAIDNGTPQGRRLQMQAQGPLRNTSYATLLYYPFGGASLGRTFADLNAMMRQRAHVPPAALHIASEQPLEARAGSRCALLEGTGDPADGHGATAFRTVFCVSPPVSGTWTALAYQTSAPVEVAPRQRATLVAIAASFRENTAEIQRQANAIAAPAIAAIREIGRQATMRAAEADATRIASRQAYEARSDAQDRSSRAFSNYLRDQSTVVDRDTGTHAQLWNQSADSLVRNDPKRYGYVDTPGFWKGVDY